jgi:hypothetical protein
MYVILILMSTPWINRVTLPYLTLPPCLLFIAESRKYPPVVVLLHNHKGLKNISTKFRQVVRQCSVLYLRYCVLRYFVKFGRHFNGSPLLCPINATSSFSYVFRLQYPRVLHCRIVPIEKLTTFVPFGRKNPPVSHLGHMTGGGIFSRNVCSPPQQPN